MVAKVEKDDYTSSDLYFFHKAIADALEVPKYQFYTKNHNNAQSGRV